MSSLTQGGARSNMLYAWYGDDFTGATDVLEALALYGMKAVLFTHTPDDHALAPFSDCKAVGMAGESRSRTPAWMNRHLPSIFKAMRELRASVNQYKICSTFDSSPEMGSIGRALELGRKAFGTKFVPVVVGAPHLGRAVVFGNLFATANGVIHRIDRHPTMRYHPVTPMTEADLRMHLSAQTKLRIGTVDLTAFQLGAVEEHVQTEVDAGAAAIVFDGVDDAMLDETARLIYTQATSCSVFAVGSSGLTHGLLHVWRGSGLIGDRLILARPTRTDRLLVLSGSCSPVTAAQIRRAEQAGLRLCSLEGPAPWTKQTATTLNALERGESVVLYTALGPRAEGGEYGDELGIALGRMLRELIRRSGVRRVLIAGGDTSTHAVRQLAIDALTFAAPLVPGVPLCRVHAQEPALDGLELVLKGGQIGPEDFFAQVRNGG